MIEPRMPLRALEMTLDSFVAPSGGVAAEPNGHQQTPLSHLGAMHPAFAAEYPRCPCGNLRFHCTMPPRTDLRVMAEAHIGRVGRRLAAIVAADVAGYSRLMGLDEVGTARTLREHREVTDALVSKHGGRLVKTTGDGVLLEFHSVVDAVEWAVAVQAVMAERNQGVPEDRRMLFRIGINLGDILIEGDDILGDGVNVAARLEGIAEPGGICVSASAYDQVTGKVAVEFADLGEQTLKNIARPIRAYTVGLNANTDRAVPPPLLFPASVHRGAALGKPRRRSRARLLCGWSDREPDHRLVAHQWRVRDCTQHRVHVQGQGH
jgi:class 3 adenylate cyclase